MQIAPHQLKLSALSPIVIHIILFYLTLSELPAISALLGLIYIVWPYLHCLALSALLGLILSTLPGQSIDPLRGEVLLLE